MSRAEELRAKARRTTERRQAAQAGEQEPAAVPTVKATPVRKTVDLAPQVYSGLTAWCAETAAELGVTRVTGQDVIATLVARLLDDPALGQSVRNDLLTQYQQRRG